ncbi:Ubiquitin-protein ligase E3A [Smittium culicis]|nr:Ubiquitin-protein ligase E3A [Smittium culicis]
MENSMTMRTELQDSFFHAMFSGVTCPYLVLEVRRDWLVRDTICQLQLKSPADLRKQLKVRFVGEDGIDEGGVQKEFFQLLVREIFDEKYGMFYNNTDSNMCWFSPEPESDALYMQEMRLVGMVLGLAVYNSVILNIHFPHALYKKLLGVPVYLNDLLQLDPSLYSSLIKILHTFSPEEIESCDQTFEVSYKQNGQHQTYQLIPNGSTYKLSFDNKIEFVNSYVDFIFNSSCESQFEVFRDGFLDIVGSSFAMNLSPLELELIICGSSDLDFDTLDKYAVYDGGYKRDTPVVE